MTGRRAVVRAVLAQVGASEWAGSNLDALADVLRDLAWLPEGEVRVTVPDLDGLDPADADAVRAVLAAAVADSAGGPRPITLRDA